MCFISATVKFYNDDIVNKSVISAFSQKILSPFNNVAGCQNMCSF